MPDRLGSPNNAYSQKFFGSKFLKKTMDIHHPYAGLLAGKKRR
jgi:hypothetical protein